MGRLRGYHQLGLAWLLLCAAAPACLAQATDVHRVRIDAIPWRQVTTEELAMTTEPRAPGASAIYLYTQIDQDQQNRAERVYQQVKVLGEEGRNRANIQLAYRDPLDTIDGIAARVIQPDGTVVEFRDRIYDRPLAVNRATGWRAKSFTLPDVRVGSVIEYQFNRRWQDTTYTSRWVLSQDLYTRHARYGMAHPSWGNLRWSWPRQLPPGTAQPVLEKGVVRLEIRDVPAFVIEPFMPPAGDMTVFVEFNWLATDKDAVTYWREYGLRTWKVFQDFIGKPRDVADVLAGIIAPGDSESQKAMKIYEHVRHMRNVWTEKPAQRSERDVALVRQTKNVRAVTKNGFGETGQLQLYFIALARAAGLEASPVLLASRQERFFDPAQKQADRLNGRIAALRLDGRDVFVDPAAGFLPFGQLYWSATGVPGLKLDKDGGQWITTPTPRPTDAVISRKAALELSADGFMEGTLEVRYSGHEAAWRIRELRYLDEEVRREFLQDDVRPALATEAQVTLVREPDWDDRDGTIDVAYQIKLPQWATPSGSRMLVGVGLFGALEKWMFISPERQHPIYFEYPLTIEDQIEIALPPGFSVQNVPAAVPATDATLAYSLSVTPREGAVSIRRTLAHNLFLVPAVHYPRIRTFFQGVRSVDEGQVVLTR